MTAVSRSKGEQGAKVSKEWSDLYQWLDERLQQLATAQIESHLRVRGDMEKGFTEIRGKFEDVFKQAWAISERTKVIETERSMERRAGMKIGAIWGAIAGALTSALSAALLRSFNN